MKQDVELFTSRRRQRDLVERCFGVFEKRWDVVLYVQGPEERVRTQDSMATDRFDFFISYARSDDRVFAAQLYSVLTAQGHSVWLDKERMPSRGQTFLHEIREAIAASTRVIVILGPSAIRSDYVQCEWQYALSLSKPVIPLLRQGSYDDIPSELRLFHAPDLRTEDLPPSLISAFQNDSFNDVINGVQETKDTATGQRYIVPLGTGTTQWVRDSKTVVESGLSPGVGFDQLTPVSH